jgi:hypothetical protein
MCSDPGPVIGWAITCQGEKQCCACASDSAGCCLGIAEIFLVGKLLQWLSAKKWDLSVCYTAGLLACSRQPGKLTVV